MRIGVATFTIQIFPAIRDLRLRTRGIGELMTIAARGCQVPTRQCETQLLVAGQGKRGRHKAIQVVALLATVEIGCLRELSVVLVLVTIHALHELDFVERGFAIWDVALCTIHGRMFTVERICGSLVGFHIEQRRLPALDRVAGGALACIRAVGELAGVLVFMAIHAPGKCYRLFEVAIGVT